MADEVIVTELIIDSTKSTAGAAEYQKAMKTAEAAQAKFIAGENAATVAMEKSASVMTMTSGSISSTAKAWDRLKASVDPAFQATQRMERALLTADAAAKKLGIDQVEVNRVLDLARAKHVGAAVAVEEGAQAAKMGATQWASLGHSARAAAESIAIGASPMQALTQQANHLSYAMSGPQGLIAASAGARASVVAFLTTPVGALAVAGTAAVAAVAGYMLATREDIKSVDEILEGHKALIDEIAKAYPAAAEAAKNYEEQAAKLPGSVVAADAQKHIDDTQKALTDKMDTVRSMLSSMGDEWAIVGSEGGKAFRELAAGIGDTSVDAEALQQRIGALRLDPKLTQGARDFAEQMQGTVNDARILESTLNSEKGLKSLGPDGVKATKTLAEVAAGFKDTGGKAAGADATIAKLFGTIKQGSGDGFGVSKGAGIQGLVGQFEQAGQAIQNMRREQVQSMLELTAQFRDTTTQVDTLKKAIATAGGKENIAAYFGDVTNIANANAEIQNSVDTVNNLFDALNAGDKTANAVAGGLDLIRQTLVSDGFGVDQVNKFIDSLIKARSQMDAGVGNAKQLDRAIQAIKNRTVTITVVTQHVGTGSKSTYDVGTTGGIGVTRYGGDSNMTQEGYSVPSESGGGSAGVTVSRFSSTGSPVSQTPIFNTSTNSWGYTQPKTYQDPYVLAQVKAQYGFATGGMIHPGDSQRVSFFKSPDETVAILTPGQRQALADPQSAFTGKDATRDTDRMWTLQMNIEANTRKAAQTLDDLKTSGSVGGGSSSSGGGSSSSGGGGSQADTQFAAYLKALATAKSNFAAAGVVGSGNIGYGAQGLGATPEQIAHRAVYGFATGGTIAPGDTQKVEFFKSPSERVIIAKPDQFEDQRGGSSGGGGVRPIVINQTHNWNGNAPPSQASQAEVRRQTAAGIRDAMRSVNGR